MSEILVSKLLESFDELERCISMTKEVLTERTGVPADVLSRVTQYADIVAKQRQLAQGLKSYLDNQNWEEVARHVRIINGLSGMIRDDAQSILSGAYVPNERARQECLV